MIELRYFTHYAPPGWAGVRKLQYRFQVHPDSAPASYESKDGVNYHAWSAWVDVPEFQEPPPAAQQPREEK